MGIEWRRQARGDGPGGAFVGLAGTERWCESDPPRWLAEGGGTAEPGIAGTRGTFETNVSGCLIAIEQAVQRGMETARLLCCHDVSIMIGTRTRVIG